MIVIFFVMTNFLTNVSFYNTHSTPIYYTEATYIDTIIMERLERKGTFSF